MTEPSSQHLYLMQNEFGCIKIGRSVDPWARSRALRVSERCAIELIAAFEGGGEHEEAIHIELSQFRLEGEWFQGTSAARAAVAEAFSDEHLPWKFEHDPLGAQKWLNHLRVVRKVDAIRREIARQIGNLGSAKGPSWVYDSHVFSCKYLAETGNRVWIHTDERNGKTFNYWINPRTERRESLPAYTSSNEEALLAWPEDIRPESWDGSALECCIAALTAIRTRLPKVLRRE